jgi:hypothetical protein
MKNCRLAVTIAVIFLSTQMPNASAAPVRVTLAAAASVTALPDGFFTLGSIAAFHGGDAALIKRLAAVEVGRAPLAGDVRHMTPGDIVLKLRQAGFEPRRDVQIDGAQTLAVTVTMSGAPSTPVASNGAAAPAKGAGPARADASPDTSIAVRKGDVVLIVLQDGSLVVTATGIAQEAGAIGQEIRVRRVGMYTDLIAVVDDNHTVELEL